MPDSRIPVGSSVANRLTSLAARYTLVDTGVDPAGVAYLSARLLNDCVICIRAYLGRGRLDRLGFRRRKALFDCFV